MIKVDHGGNGLTLTLESSGLTLTLESSCFGLTLSLALFLSWLVRQSLLLNVNAFPMRQV